MITKNPVCYIIVRENKILLVKRSDNDNSEPGKWSFPGGGPLETENFEDCLFRELKEEINCQPLNPKYFKSYCIIEEDKIFRAVYFYGDINGELKLNEELSEFKWFDVKNQTIFDLEFAYNQKEILTEVIEEIR